MKILICSFIIFFSVEMFKKTHILFVLLVLGTYSQNSNCSQCASCQTDEIQIEGVGKASMVADVAYVNFTIEQQSKTFDEAKVEINKMTDKIATILKGSGLNSTVYSMKMFRSEANKMTTLVESFLLEIQKVDNQTKNLAKILDDMANITALKIKQVYFDVQDKPKMKSEAKAAAFKDAKDKADEYAKLANFKVDKLLEVKDFIKIENSEFDKHTPTNATIGQLVMTYKTVVRWKLI